VDEMSMLLDRFVEAQRIAVAPPPVAVIEARARRRSSLRTLTSLGVVLALVVGLVVGLASAGLASDSAPGSTSGTVALAEAR
jgi:hypothetical protein